MTKKLIMILGLVLSSMLMKAQAFLCLSRRLATSIGKSEIPVRGNEIRIKPSIVRLPLQSMIEGFLFNN